MEHWYNRGASPAKSNARSSSSSSSRSNSRSSSAVATASIATVLQYLVSAAALLVPSSYPYYEVVCEGIHSLSQLLPYLNRLALNSRDEDVIQQCSRLESVLRVVTKSVGFVEVFAERLANTAGSEQVYAATIFFIELLKSTCRLAVLADRRRSSMLVMWGTSERVGSSSDMSNYREWYRIVSVQHRSRSGPPQPEGRSPETPASPLKEQEGVYRGRRSGLLLPRSDPNPPSPSLQEQSAPHRLLPPSPLGGPPNARTSFLSRPALTPEHLLAIGEVLYVVRPAAYAWALHRIATRRGGEGAASVSREAREASAERSLSPRASGAEHAMALGLSLVIELLSIQLSSAALRMARDEVNCSAPPSGSRLHCFDQELRRRRTALLFYLIRSPLFDRATLPALKALLHVFLQVPMLGAVPKYALNVLVYLNECHFYNSNS